MKNKKKMGRILASLLLAIALCVTAVPAQIVQAVTPVRVNPKKLTLNEGYKSRIMITGTKSKATYSSSNKTG